MHIRRFVVLALLGLGAVAGCGDDHSHDEGGHDPNSEVCQAIMDACHDVDTGEGEIGECHDIAHDDDHDACVAHRDHCIPLCEAAAADGGEPHDEDAGHEES